MKIVIDGLIYYLQKQGGISRYFDELIEGYSKIKGCDVTILLRNNNINKVFSKNIKIEIINSNIDCRNKLTKYFSILRDIYIMNKYIKVNNFADSVFHYSYYSYYKNLKGKSVITVHDMSHERLPNFFHGLMNKIYLMNKKKTIMKADKIIAVSEQTKRDLVDIYGIDPKNINVIYHGISKAFKVLDDKELNTSINKNEINKPFFIYVGNRGLYKNFNFLLRSFCQWDNKKDFDLYCLGGGNFSYQEKLLINKLKLNFSVKIFPYVSEEDLVLFYNKAKALIYPSLYEGFGFPVLEAMACGTIVLASDIEVFKEIGHSVPIYFDPHNQQSMIRALNHSLTLSSDRIKIGLELSSQYNWANTIEKTLQLYKN